MGFSDYDLLGRRRNKTSTLSRQNTASLEDCQETWTPPPHERSTLKCAFPAIVFSKYTLLGALVRTLAIRETLNSLHHRLQNPRKQGPKTFKVEDFPAALPSGTSYPGFLWPNPQALVDPASGPISKSFQQLFEVRRNRLWRESRMLLWFPHCSLTKRI